jgi:phospholipase C
MRCATVLIYWTVLLCTAGLLVQGGCVRMGVLSSQKIQHVVVIFQENRTPDNLFHGLPNADIANSGVNSLGQAIPMTPISLANGYDLDHSHSAFVSMFRDGKMNGADQIRVSCPQGDRNCAPPNPQFKYVDPSDAAPYLQLAQRYAFGDRMFQTNQGPSFPAHQFIISGTSAPTATSNLFVAENPTGVPNAASNTGCTAPSGEFVALIDPSGAESSTLYPCFEHATLTDLLDSKNISWRYYTPSAGSIWTGPNAIRHLRMGPDWNNDVILQNTQILLDIDQGHLASVSWVIPTGQASDHPKSNDGSGPSWVSAVVNAVGKSSYWANTAILITWDDWGGWYDHVPPPIMNSYEYGFRVPLIVVSPYAKPGYVSHVTHDFGSIIRFVEEIFGLPSLGYADAHADNLSDCFDFTQTPSVFHPIAARYEASHFLNDNTPPLDPDDD